MANIKKENYRDICIGLITVALLFTCFKGKSPRTMDKCQGCDRMEQTMSGMRQRMAPQQQRGSRSSEGKGEWKKEGKGKN